MNVWTFETNPALNDMARPTAFDGDRPRAAMLESIPCTIFRNRTNQPKIVPALLNQCVCVAQSAQKKCIAQGVLEWAPMAHMLVNQFAQESIVSGHVVFNRCESNVKCRWNLAA